MTIDSGNASHAKSELTADQPISSASEDLLERAPFARQLAVAIANWKEDQSLVISLNGDWGIGKTSVKNLALEELKKRDDRLDLVEFNPWHWTGHDDLAAAFFKEILGVLQGTKGGPEAQAVARSLRRYAAYLGLLHGFLSPPKGFLVGVLALLGFLSLSLPSFISTQSAVTLAKTMGMAVIIVAIALQWGQQLLERLAAWRDLSGISSQPLEERRKAVAAAIRRLRRTVLVVIDDVDRLTAPEIQTVFQLIKGNADFPRFVFLVLFQREIVEDALNAVTNKKAAEYLEKIIQVRFDLPQPRQDQVDSLVSDGIGRILGPADSERVDQAYWGNIYHGSLRGYFRDLRDVKRFLASLEFHVGLLRVGGALEVNAVDLIAIESVRLFDAEFYQRIRRSRSLLTTYRTFGGSERKETSEEIKQLIVGVSSQEKDAEELIKNLFPNAGFAFGAPSYSAESFDQWRRELRVCTAEFFDRYFMLGLARQEISQSEVERLVRATSDMAALYEGLERLSKDGLLIAALDSLFANRNGIQPQDVVPTLTALFDAGELLPERHPGSFFDGPEWTINRIGYQLLSKLPENERSASLEAILASSRGLRLPVMFVSIITNPADRQKSAEPKLIPDAELPRLEQIALSKIRAAKEEGILIHQIELSYILFRWLQWAGDREPRDWSAAVTGSPQGALVFLRSFLHKGTSTTVGDYVTRTTYFMKYSEIERFVDVFTLESQISKLTEVRLPEPDRMVVQEFRKAVARKRSGKKEGDWGFDND